MKEKKKLVHYIALLKFTSQGARNIKKSTSRAKSFDKLAHKSGVTVVGQYWTVGRFDEALILAATDEAKILHLLAALAEIGNVRAESLRAFTHEEFDRIISA